MKTEFLSKRSPYHILGVPTFANAKQIDSAYAKRVEMLDRYRFDKATQPMEWQVVNEILQDLNNAYAQLRLPYQTGMAHSELTPASQVKPGIPVDDNDDKVPVSIGNGYR